MAKSEARLLYPREDRHELEGRRVVMICCSDGRNQQ